MHGVSLLLLALPALAVAAPSFAEQVALAKRAVAAPTSSTALADMINLITPGCNTTCTVFIKELSNCALGASQMEIATCACSSQVLGDIRTCAACVSADKDTTTANSTAVVNDYNQFVSLCIADGLATVTGTVAVGASTVAISRTLTTLATGTATSAPASNATYTVPASITAATQVASLGLGSSNTSSSASGSAGHRRKSFTDDDIDELVELRARQRTFDGAYIRAALGNFGYACIILKVFDAEFAKGAITTLPLAPGPRIWGRNFRTSGDVVVLVGVVVTGLYAGLFAVVLKLS
ncbi:hypothetical protein RQP46_002483 [Phenoliferia psychrophenolica]